MFDWYTPVPDLPCPECGSALHEWQGKDGPSALFVWRQGTKSPIDQTADEDAKLPPDRLAVWRLPARFAIYSWCDCGRRVEAEGTCDGETWSNTRVSVSAG